MVPESDPNVSIINDKIQALKDSIQRISGERGQVQEELKKVMEVRCARFIEFFD